MEGCGGGRQALAACVLAIGTARADTLSSAGSPSPADVFALEENWVAGLGLVTDFRFLPDGRVVVIEKTGGVSIRRTDGSLVVAGSFAVDSDSEKGLLGLAVDPQFATNRRLYFYYSATNADQGTDADRHRVVVRTLTGDRLDAGETVLLHGLRGPANHDGGALDVGPDGLLYVGVGDTGCNSSQPAEAQMPTNFYGTCLADDPQANGGGNGKILRIALDGSIPATNPLVGATNVSACGDACGVDLSPSRLGAPRADVFAWGFRNPFRLWVDPLTALVWVGDVGEISYEEIDVVRPGRHHGWPWREGARGFRLGKCADVRVGTTPGGLRDRGRRLRRPDVLVQARRRGGARGRRLRVDHRRSDRRHLHLAGAVSRALRLRRLRDQSTLHADAHRGARRRHRRTRALRDHDRRSRRHPHRHRRRALRRRWSPRGASRASRRAWTDPASTTTTTTSTTSTTSTTVDPCPELTGAAHVACRLDAAAAGAALHRATASWRHGSAAASHGRPTASAASRRRRARRASAACGSAPTPRSARSIPSSARPAARDASTRRAAPRSRTPSSSCATRSRRSGASDRCHPHPLGPAHSSCSTPRTPCPVAMPPDTNDYGQALTHWMYGTRQAADARSAAVRTPSRHVIAGTRAR